jgi:uncharacterized membrane protein
MDILDDGGVMLFWTPEAPSDERIYREALRRELGSQLLVALELEAHGTWLVSKAISPLVDDLRAEVVRVLSAAGLRVG